MPTPPLSPELMREAVEAFKANGFNKTLAAEALGISRNTFTSRYQRAITLGFDEKIVSEAPAGHTIKGVSTLYDAGGNVAMQWVKTRADQPSIEEIAEAIKGAIADFDERSPYFTPPDNTDTHIATIVPLADFHIGLLAWHREVGTDWDLTIAQTVIRASMSRLMAATTPSSECVILGLGDLLHSDGYDPVTARSKNQLDVDGRWPKVLRAAVDLIIYSVSLALLRHAHVTVRILPGNHDTESAIAVALALSLYYSENPRVTVDEDPSYFWWWSWGTILLGATHGDKARMKDLPLVMAARNPEAWGRAKHRHIYSGHIHTQTGIEMSGVTVESFRTPAAPDAWHSSMGYGAGRSLTAITLHKMDGEIGRVRSNIVASD